MRALAAQLGRAGRSRRRCSLGAPFGGDRQAAEKSGVELDEELGWHGVRIELALRTEATDEDGRRARDVERRHDVSDPVAVLRRVDDVRDRLEEPLPRGDVRAADLVMASRVRDELREE